MKKKKSTKPNNKIDNTNTSNTKSSESLWKNNIYLLMPIFTFVVFNFFKENFFEGHIIKFITFFHMFVSTMLVFNLTVKNSDFYNSSKHAFSLLFIINLISYFNPCKKYMNFVQSNLFFIISLSIIFNIMNYYLNKCKDENCSSSDNKIIFLLLLGLNLALVYFDK